MEPTRKWVGKRKLYWCQWEWEGERERKGQKRGQKVRLLKLRLIRRNCGLWTLSCLPLQHIKIPLTNPIGSLMLITIRCFSIISIQISKRKKIINHPSIWGPHTIFLPLDPPISYKSLAHEHYLFRCDR